MIYSAVIVQGEKGVFQLCGPQKYLFSYGWGAEEILKEKYGVCALHESIASSDMVEERLRVISVSWSTPDKMDDSF